MRKFIRDTIFKIVPFPYVLMFHHVSNDHKINKSKCALEFDEFKNFVLEFDGCYTSISNIVENKRKVKGKIAITFDDGLEDLYTLAYPFLKEHNIPFTAFIVTDFLDKEGYITTEQLKEMSSDPLVTIGAHGTTHKIFPELSTEDKKRELLDSQAILRDLTNTPVKYFAYSHGQYDDETLSLMDCYDAAFSANVSLMPFFKWKRHLIPRFNIETSTLERQLDFFRKAPLKRKK